MLDGVRERRADQASGLRKLFRPRGLRVLPVAAALDLRPSIEQLAAALAAAGERVLILDHGWTPARLRAGDADLGDVLRGRSSLDSAAFHLTDQVRRMHVGGGFSLMGDAGLDGRQLFLGLRGLEPGMDMVVLATGRPRTVAQLLGAQADFLVFAVATAAGVANAYQLLKSISSRGPRVRLVFDGVERRTTAEQAFRRIEITASRFLGVVPLLGGWLPRESDVAPLHGTGPAFQAMQRVARAALQWDLAEYPPQHESVSAPGVDVDLQGVLAQQGTLRGRHTTDGAGEAHTAAVRSVRRARTRREW